jgi:ribosomal-protein-alanine N-acetyltransferase
MTELQSIILETPRLILRRLTLDDLDALAALYSDPVVRKYYPEGTLTRAETLEELQWIIDVYYGQYGYGLWATILKENGALIGRCGLLPWTLEGRFEVEVAYMIAKEYWGRGLATEAARDIVEYAVREWRFPRLICLIDADNGASQAVARKIGMTFEKEIDDGKGPAQMYAMQTGV